MFVIRQAIPDDAGTMLKLAKMVHSNNLPADPDIIRESIRNSELSFAGKIDKADDREFIFVLEDTDTGNMIGTSSIISRVGKPERPHLYFQVRKREHYSNDLQSGAVHVTLQLCADTSGHTEIGGLILGPSYRGHKAKLGSVISLIRFQFMALHREYFRDRVIAEMAPQLTQDSRNTLWDYLGRRFINLEYAEADRFCRTSAEFITSLFPQGEIYAAILPPEARNLIGKVSPEAEPARHLLERLGFKSVGHADPFDGGPYLEARIDEIPLVKQTQQGRLVALEDDLPVDGFVSVAGDSGFRAKRTTYAIDDGEVRMPAIAAEAIGAEIGDEVAVMPRTPHAPNADTGANAGARGARARGSTKRASNNGASHRVKPQAAASPAARKGKARKTRT